MVLSATIVAAVFAGSSPAAERELPWASGQAVVSQFEGLAAQWANQFSRRSDVQVICNGNTDWGILAAQQNFNPDQIWGYVFSRFNPATFQWEPLNYTHVSEAACLYADRFWGAADKQTTKNCQTGSTPVYEERVVTKVKYVWKTVKKRVKGKMKKVRVRKKTTVRTTVTVKVGDQPIYSVCSDWNKTLFALNTFSHETMHLGGIRSESLAECYSLQLLARVAIHFGATPEFAREIAADYLAAWYTPARGAYWRADCVDGGPLDLVPASTSWPAGY